MVEYKNAGLFTADSVTKEARIEYSAGTIRNGDLFQNSEELEEVLCTGQELRFGQCSSSSFKFKVANIVKNLAGEWLTFSLVLNHDAENPFLVGRYRVESDKLAADRMHREVVAYDAMRDVLLADVAGWYNALLPDTDEGTWVTLRSFRTSFFQHFGLEQEDAELANDSMQVRRTIEPERLSGKDVAEAMCEINGCFGRIGRDGRLRYVRLRQNMQGLYPAEDLFPGHAPDCLTAQADTGHLYPQAPGSYRFGSGGYISCKYDGYVTKPINKVQIRKEENDIGKIWPETDPGGRDNTYIVQGNFLLYGKSSDELAVIAQNLLGAIQGAVYRPFAAECAGNPCLEVGDPVRFLTKFDIVESYGIVCK